METSMIRQDTNFLFKLNFNVNMNCIEMKFHSINNSNKRRLIR